VALVSQVEEVVSSCDSCQQPDQKAQLREQHELSVATTPPTSISDWLITDGPSFYIAWSKAYFLVCTSKVDVHLHEAMVHCLALGCERTQMTSEHSVRSNTLSAFRLLSTQRH
jgi:hypothetical protein